MTDRRSRTRADAETERDAYLQGALRHAPDADVAPPAALSEAILREARGAAAVPAARNREAAAASPRSIAAAAAASLAAFWSWLARPPVAAGFASLMVATLAGVMWWGEPIERALDRPAPMDGLVGASAGKSGNVAVAPAAAPPAASAELAAAPGPVDASQRDASANLSSTLPAAPQPPARRKADPVPAPAPDRVAAADVSMQPRTRTDASPVPAAAPGQGPPPAAAHPGLNAAARIGKRAALAASGASGPAESRPGIAGAPLADTASPARSPAPGLPAKHEAAAPPAAGAAAPAQDPAPVMAGAAAKSVAAPAASAESAQPRFEARQTDSLRADRPPALGQGKLAMGSNLVERPSDVRSAPGPIGWLRAQVEPQAPRWRWRIDGAEWRPVDAPLLQWLARLDEAAGPSWTMAAADAPAADATKLELFLDGAPHSAIELGAKRLRFTTIDRAWPPDTRAALPAPVALDLRTALERLLR